MSKRRQNIPVVEGDLLSSEETDLRPYVIFTQLESDGPYHYAGWLDAADDRMALFFGREHYGQDQSCTRLWAIPRTAISGTDPDHPPSTVSGPQRPFMVFRKKRRGDTLLSAETVTATNGAAALEQAVRRTPDAARTWVVAEADIASTDPADVIWRYTDQTYRLARGYSKEVRTKWKRVRELRALEEYEKEDLHETF